MDMEAVMKKGDDVDNGLRAFKMGDYVGLQLRVRELWRELFTRACILI